MKFHNIYIDTKNSLEKYNNITEILNIEPTQFVNEESKSGDSNYFDIWTYQVVTNGEESHFDFVNEFLDILEPKFKRLAEIDIQKPDITFWLFYKFDQQCSLSYNPQEMKRLGESGIAFNIDCIMKK